MVYCRGQSMPIGNVHGHFGPMEDFQKLSDFYFWLKNLIQLTIGPNAHLKDYESFEVNGISTPNSFLEIAKEAKAQIENTHTSPIQNNGKILLYITGQPKDNESGKVELMTRFEAPGQKKNINHIETTPDIPL